MTHSTRTLARFAALAATATLAAVPAVAPAAPVSRSTAVAARTCSAGFRHARINGAEKCLRVGEFCAHAYDRHAPRHYAYRHYGYRCVKRDSRGSYHLTRA
jgi:hypothetical protein